VTGGHGHGRLRGHASTGERGRRVLAAVLAITVSVLLVQLVGVAVSGSLALLADAGHVLTDAAGLSLALMAAVLAAHPPTPRRTWGYQRAEVLAAGAQAAVLLAVGVYVVVEALRRLQDPVPVDGAAMAAFGMVGLLGNVACLVLLTRAGGPDLNTRAARLEVFADALGSVAVLVAAAAVVLTGWVRADAAVSLLVGAGFTAISYDLAQARPDNVWSQALEAGVDLWPGVVPSTRPETAVTDAELTDRLLRFFDRLGHDAPTLAQRIVVTPACGLAGSSPDWTREALRLATRVAAAVTG